MKTKLVSLLLLTLILGCGPYKVEVSGEVDHKFSFDLEELRVYFKKVCQNQTPPPADIDDCVDEKVGDFLDAISGN